MAAEHREQRTTVEKGDNHHSPLIYRESGQLEQSGTLRHCHVRRRIYKRTFRLARVVDPLNR
jgi:hypothetical protein